MRDSESIGSLLASHRAKASHPDHGHFISQFRQLCGATRFAGSHPQSQSAVASAQAAFPLAQALFPFAQGRSVFAQTAFRIAQTRFPFAQVIFPSAQPPNPFAQARFPFAQGSNPSAQRLFPFAQASNPLAQGAFPIAKALFPSHLCVIAAKRRVQPPKRHIQPETAVLTHPNHEILKMGRSRISIWESQRPLGIQSRLLLASARRSRLCATFSNTNQ